MSHTCDNVDAHMIELNVELGLPLPLNLVTSWFGGMTSSFVIVNFPVFYYSNAI